MNEIANRQSRTTGGYEFFTRKRNDDRPANYVPVDYVDLSPSSQQEKPKSAPVDDGYEFFTRSRNDQRPADYTPIDYRA